MRRRLFLQSGPAAIALALTGCGGGGGGSDFAAGSLAMTGATGARTEGLGYPFGARIDGYVAGILPSVDPAQMDNTIAGFYDQWKARAIVDVPTVPGGKAVKFANSTQWLTVSEGVGYGMLLAVLLAGHDRDAQALFDGLLTTVRARPAYSIPATAGGPSLMDWRLTIDGTSTDAAGGGWNAMDGDLDIAMALLMADRQWGSGGRWNYLQEGIGTINAIKAFNMKPDGATKGLPHPDNNRTSDYMTGHFRAFSRATGDRFWDRAVDRAYQLIDRMQRVYSPDCGLMPDFVINTHTDTPSPSTGFIGDNVATEGYFYANACRNPWRFGTDYVTTGDTRWRDVCAKLLDFIQRDTGGDPGRTSSGYHLDGFAMDRSYSPKGTIGPMTCGAMVDPAFQGFLDASWHWTVRNFTTDYYDCELQLIPLIVASGNWWNP